MHAYKTAKRQAKTVDRLRHLGAVIRDALERVPGVDGAMLSVCYLFYDDYDMSPSWKSHSLEEMRVHLDLYKPMQRA